MAGTNLKTSGTVKKCAGTENMIDTTPYSKAMINWYYKASNSVCYCKFACGTQKNIDMEWPQYSPTTLNFLYKKHNLNGSDIV